MSLMSVTCDTSHVPIGPCGPLEQSSDSLRHMLIASLSSFRVFGENTFISIVYIQLPIEEEAKPPSLHAKKLPLPSQWSSYTPLHALEPCFSQKACAAVRVENEPPCSVLAQRLRFLLVQEPEKPTLAGVAVGDVASVVTVVVGFVAATVPVVVVAVVHGDFAID